MTWHHYYLDGRTATLRSRFILLGHLGHPSPLHLQPVSRPNSPGLLEASTEAPTEGEAIVTMKEEEMLEVGSTPDATHPPLQVSWAGAPSTPLWLGETSSAWGGGAPTLSDTWVSGQGGEQQENLTEIKANH